MPHKSLSNPSFIRVGELMGEDIQKVLATKADEVADLIADGVKRKRKTPINEAKKILNKLCKDEGVDAANFARLKRIMNKGANEVSDAALLKRHQPRIDRILKNVSGTVTASSDHYLERIVLPKMNKLIAKGGTPDQVRTLVKKSMDDAQHYWDNVANTAASRSFHYGSMIAAENSGLKKCTYVAVIDQATTPFCRSIDGKTVSLGNAIIKAETILMQPPDEMLADNFWSLCKGLQDAENVTASSIMKNGLTLPPFHGHCRTTSFFS